MNVHWCWRRECNRTPKSFDLVKIREKSLKIRTKSVEIWAKFVERFAKLLHVLWSYENGTQNQSADVLFFGGHVFLFFSGKLGEFGQVRGNLSKNGAWSVLWCFLILKKCALVLFDFKNAPNMRRNAVVFFWGHFLWSFFRASLGKFGQKSFVPPNICLLLHLCERLTKVRNQVIATHRITSSAETLRYNGDKSAIHAVCTLPTNTKPS